MPPTPNLPAPQTIGLLASEVTTRGGIQSFMLRITEVIGSILESNPGTAGYCLSLNDSSKALRQHPAMPAAIRVWGANRSKAKLMAHALFKQPHLDVLFVGHLGLAPVAHVLKALGRVRDYYVILHGIEAWRRVPYVDRRALLAATNIIATTRYTAEECARHNHLPADRFRIIPLCADERNVTPSPTFKLNGEFKLLCVARQDATERYKGFEHIFQSLAQLQPTHPNIHLNMVGTGDDQKRLKAVANDLGVGHQVTFWGALSDEDLAAAFQGCDIYVMPSEREGFGIVYLEAMRYGKPCIGGNHGGTPEVIEDGKSGYLTEYGDIAALEMYIRRLEDAPSLRQSLGEKGTKLVQNQFSFESFESRYRYLMRQIEQ